MKENFENKNSYLLAYIKIGHQAVNDITEIPGQRILDHMENLKKSSAVSDYRNCGFVLKILERF